MEDNKNLKEKKNQTAGEGLLLFAVVLIMVGIGFVDRDETSISQN